EILIVTAKAPPAWVAADLIAQAEHDTDARAVCITTSRRLAERIAREIEARMPAEGPARRSLAAHGAIVIATDRADAARLANLAAAEHVVVDDEDMAARIVQA